jgi:hypothetical protein
MGLGSRGIRLGEARTISLHRLETYDEYHETIVRLMRLGTSC